MAYEKINWQARTGSGLNRFEDQHGTILELTAAPTEVITPGTPVSADNLNHMEAGIAGAYGLLVTGLSLPTSGYSGSGPYTKAFTVTGASTDAGKRYLLIPDWSSTAATRALEKAAWNLIDDYDITETNKLTITVTKVPVTAVSFSLKEVV